MTQLAEKAPKGERLEVRVTPNAKALLVAAAQARHTSVSEFLLTHGIAAATQAVAEPRVFYASEAGWAALGRLLDEADVAPQAAQIAWMTAQRRKGK